MNSNHIMIDIETLDVQPSAVIASIGAIRFDLLEQKTGEFLYYVINIQSCLDLGMTVRGDTIDWWMTQSDEARSIFSPRVERVSR